MFMQLTNELETANSVLVGESAMDRDFLMEQKLAENVELSDAIIAAKPVQTLSKDDFLTWLKQQ